MFLIRRFFSLFSTRERDPGESLVVEIDMHSSPNIEELDTVFLSQKNIGQIETVNVSGTVITTLPESISRFTNLRVLDLSKNNFRDFPKSVCYLKKLEVLDLSSNGMKKLPVALFSLVSLKSLNLSHNQLTALPSKLLLLCNLKTLELTGNKITNPSKEICDKGKDAVFAALRERDKNGRQNLWKKWKPFYEPGPDDSVVKSLMSLCIDCILYGDVDFMIQNNVPPVLKNYLSEEKNVYRPENIPHLHKCSKCKGYFSSENNYMDHACDFGVTSHY